MSTNWEIFHTEIDGRLAFIQFDDGVAHSINQIDLPNLVKFQIEFASPAPEGLAPQSEMAVLNNLEEEISSWCEDTGGCYVGRVTGDGCQTYFCYTAQDRLDAEMMAEHLNMHSGYEIGLGFDADPEKTAYWEGLYPTDQERRSILDMKVIESLQAQGDRADLDRTIDHFASIDTRQQADMFVNWLRKERFCIEQVAAPDEDLPFFLVAFNHRGRPILDEIAAHTIAISEHARSLGGRYEGWTCEICETMH